jgi:hypothetical protein
VIAQNPVDPPKRFEAVFVPAAICDGQMFAAMRAEAPRTYVRGICQLQALERLPPKRGLLSLHGLTSMESREGS